MCNMYIILYKLYDEFGSTFALAQSFAQARGHTDPGSGSEAAHQGAEGILFLEKQFDLLRCIAKKSFQFKV